MEKGGTKAQGGNIEQRARELCAPIVEQNGFELWDVCFEKEGAMWYLRVLFDKAGGIDTDECEALTEPINAVIDKQDFLKYIDIVEVGSPGLTKKLRRPEHFEKCLGMPIVAAVRGEKGKTEYLTGTLKSYDKEKDLFTIECEGEEKTLAVSKTIKINTNL